MLKDRIKYAMQHLSHKQYISLLARPNWRRIQRRNINVLVNPYRTRRAALKAHASKRINVMAKPKHVSGKYDPTRAPLPFTRIHPKTLSARPSKRIIDLALPKKRLLLSNMRFSTSGNIAETLWKVQNSRYRRYRFFCNARQQREMKKKQKIMAKLRRAIKPHEWNAHMKIMEKLATPKVLPRPRFVVRKASQGKRKKWRPVNMQRIEDLSTPLARDVPMARDVYRIPATALTYQITRRLNEISLPRMREGSIQLRSPLLGMVAPAALRAIATPRLINLAKPVERPAGMETDLRENAFTVSPTALKAKCSRRLKVLARPKRYK